MKTKEQIKEAIERLKVNKTKTDPYTNLGDNKHGAINAMIETLQRNYNEDDAYDAFDTGDDDSDFITDAAISIIEWREGDADLDDYLYPER